MEIKIPISVDNASFNSSEVEEAGLDGTRATELITVGSPSTGVIAQYKLNDNLATTNVIDSSGNGHDGTLIGGDNTEDKSATGKINEAFDLNGSDDYINITNHADFRPTYFTVSAWVKHTATGYRNIFQSYYQNTYIQGIEFRQTDAEKLQLVSGDDSGLILGTHYQVATSATSINTGDWVHVAGTYDGVKLRVYINGVNDGETAWTKDPDYDTLNNRVNIGVNNYTGSTKINYFDGLIDDVRFFSTALSADRIALLYNEGSGTEDELPEGYPTTTDIILDTLDSGFNDSTWDMSTIDVYENPNSEAGALTYQYAYGNTDDPTNWNESWVTLTALKALSDVDGRYLRIKTRFTGDGTQATCISDGVVTCDVTSGGG